MEETEDKLPKEFIEAFNVGYEFSKAFPEVSQSIREQDNNAEIEINPIGGIMAGIEQNLKEARELFNERMNELKIIENKNIGHKDHEIDR